MISRKTFAAWTATLALAIALPAGAQTAPALRLVSGYAPGGVTDTIARIIAEPLQAELGRPVIVENRAGAGGRLAGEFLKNARPDGSTYLIGPDGWAIFQTLLYPPAALKYDFLKDFAAVGRLVSYPLAVVVGPGAPVANAKDYAAWLKEHPSKALYGTAAAGGQTQFIGDLLGKSLGTPLTIVPYKGNGPLVTELLGGQVPAGVLVLGDALKLRSDKLKVVGVIADKRWSLTPDLPTLKEQGYNVTAGMAWQGMWAPAGTPAAEIQRMEAALKKVLARADVRKRLEELAVVTADFSSAAELDRDLRAALAFWDPIIKQSGFKPE